MKPQNFESLLSSLVRSETREEKELEELRKMARNAQGRPEVGVWMEDLLDFMPPAAHGALAEILQFALMGLCLGFLDRDLSPYVEAHRAIIPPLLEDISRVFEQVEVGHLKVTQEVFCHRAFSYGIHKAYYLDWTLYLSHEPY